jgi:hypothetical protein
MTDSGESQAGPNGETGPRVPCGRGHVLSLCDRTGVMVEPWFAAGFDCTIVDLQHPTGEVTEGRMTYVGADVTRWLPPMRDYAIVFAFPPCTHLAKSGARWWGDKGLDALIEALTVVNACRKICEQTGAPYMIENPSGALSTHWRKPDHAFDPLDFGAYVLDGEDYTKLTNLWVGGGFVMPPKRPIPMGEGPNPIHWMGASKDRADRRSITPRGFAQAVFEANHGQHVEEVVA